MNKIVIPAVAAFALMAVPAVAAEQQPAGKHAGQQAGQHVPQAGEHELIGMGIVDQDNEDVGEIENVLVDGKGQVKAVIMQRGTGAMGLGVLGGGDRVAVPFERIKLPEARPGTPSDEQSAKINMTQEELGELPEFESEREGRQQDQRPGATGTTGTQPGTTGTTGTGSGQQR